MIDDKIVEINNYPYTLESLIHVTDNALSVR